MKHEWRKAEKQYYLPGAKPEIIRLPSFNFITIKGEGNPNEELFAQNIKTLYSISYAIKMSLKKLEIKPLNYQDYTVYPLEGVWDLNDEAKKKFTGMINKDDLVYTLMIRQPDFVDFACFERLREATQRKKPELKLNALQFASIEDGECIQFLHKGSFNGEPASFEIMEDFAKKHGKTRASKKHREIYLSDFRKVPAEKLKTVLRFRIN
ncbi:MAG: GyrI-like domain-containing protein [Bacteroidota bacterium]